MSQITVTSITAGYVAPSVVGLTAGATLAVNAALGNDFRVTLSASAAMANPTDPADGQRITFQITQGTGGGYTVTWGSAYNFGAAGPPTLSTGAGQTDIVGFIYNSAKGAWLYAGSMTGY
jgi:hypothetical protein